MKTHIYTALLIIAVAVLVGFGVHKYQVHKDNTKPAVTVSQIQSELNTEEKTLALHDAVTKVDAGNYQTEIAGLCSDLASHKITNSYCH
jgi:hypothetical protein